jgi:hypothetical protein
MVSQQRSHGDATEAAHVSRMLAERLFLCDARLASGPTGSGKIIPMKSSISEGRNGKTRLFPEEGAENITVAEQNQ